MAGVLNQRQLAFVLGYVAGGDGVRGNATKSAEAAGYSAKTAGITGCKLLKNPKVAAAVAELQAKAEAKAVRKLRDWNEMAAEAQDRVEQLAQTATAFDGVKLNANLHIISRAIGPIPKEIKHSGAVSIDVLLDATDDD